MLRQHSHSLTAIPNPVGSRVPTLVAPLRACAYTQGGDQAQAGAGGQSALPFVRKWIRTKHAIVFRLGSNVVQLNFFDHTKLILNTPAGLVTFIDKAKVAQTYSLDEIAIANPPTVHELASRLAYAVEMIPKLQGSHPGGTAC